MPELQYAALGAFEGLCGKCMLYKYYLLLTNTIDYATQGCRKIKVVGDHPNHWLTELISHCHVVPRCNKCDIAPFTYIFPPQGMHLVGFMLSCIFNVSDYNTM